MPSAMPKIPELLNVFVPESRRVTTNLLIEYAVRFRMPYSGPLR